MDRPMPDAAPVSSITLFLMGRVGDDMVRWRCYVGVSNKEDGCVGCAVTTLSSSGLIDDALADPLKSPMP